MTNEQMRAAAQHIKYELDAFVHAFRAMLAHRTRPPLDSLLEECFLLHFRILWEFFHLGTSSRYPDDIRAAAFVGKTYPSAPLITTLHDRANKLLAHLTLGRLGLPGFTMQDVEAIREHIRLTCVAFGNDLSAEQKLWFAKNPLGERRFPKVEAWQVL
jgi:hypothetical protein